MTEPSSQPASQRKAFEASAPYLCQTLRHACVSRGFKATTTQLKPLLYVRPNSCQNTVDGAAVTSINSMVCYDVMARNIDFPLVVCPKGKLRPWRRHMDMEYCKGTLLERLNVNKIPQVLGLEECTVTYSQPSLLINEVIRVDNHRCHYPSP